MLKAAKSQPIKNRSRYDGQLLSYVILLRFGSLVTPDFSKPTLNFQSIAKVIKKPVTTVIEFVKLGIRAYHYGFYIGPPNRSKFTQQHIGYLVSPSTLQEIAHLSLAERAQMFHRRFGEKKISPSTIRSIYLNLKIRFKKSSEAREKLTLLNRIIALSSIERNHYCIK
jgi:hypothetical protein